MGTIKMKDKTTQEISDLDAQILKNAEIAKAEQVRQAVAKEASELAGALYEEKSLRGENTKLWRMNDGTMRQIISPNAIHYRDASGELQEIDNTISEQENAFEASEGERKVSFAKSASAENLMRLQKNGMELRWNFCKRNDAGNAVMRVAATQPPQPAPAAARSKNTGNGVVYENIADGVDSNTSL
ncbi:MAG: hypothetical protein HFE35_07995 [Clostridia bacterium]|nr:hypothetical protein [Clostridia bacterium]